MKDVKFIIDRIKELCELKGITVHRLLVHCGLNTTLVANMQRKGTIPSVKSISKIAEYFDVTIEYLIGNSNIPSGQPTPVSLSKNAFGETLQQLRKSKKISQQQLADYLQIKRNAISRYETGVRDPDYQTLVRIAKYFHVSVDYLLGNQFTPDSDNSNRNKDLSLTKEQIQMFSNEVQAALNKLLKSLQQEDEV